MQDMHAAELTPINISIQFDRSSTLKTLILSIVEQFFYFFESLYHAERMLPIVASENHLEIKVYVDCFLANTALSVTLSFILFFH
jgi:hypothetical protein